eukprot:CAMPEP_0201893942 /NCGR_PEP_ID=MMETSP0902-20130614/39735_1 /ASSEMBLY_ACC=CAM_ASM_000551 /TAXON_ID=420261 /ORGANISM="Thalassiosira antarctica, Strain CCMP982" /LENGTH=427 /DNA_ID=CAMNT_0048425889 /DNA_START=105 /DNA_END=1385 /DNA_ORIENTATION=-
MMTSSSEPTNNGFRNRGAHLTVNVNDDTAEQDGGRNDPKTPPGVRGHHDLRSPGVKKTPLNADARQKTTGFYNDDNNDPAAENAAAAAIPDFMTQTDKYGNATTPRTAEGISAARRMHPSGPKPKLHVDGETGALIQGDGVEKDSTASSEVDDPCDTLLDSFRMMCCCLYEDGTQPSHGTAALPGTSGGGGSIAKVDNVQKEGSTTAPNTPDSTPSYPIGYSTRGHDAPLLLEEHSALRNANDPNRFKLLPELHVDDRGKKCLVLDLDETLVHSSFRAVPGADFVIPVQIEDVVHFVYVAKRPGVDEFLLEMAKHYEIVVYTASLNKYADVLLDLLDPHRVIRTRLFRESCVFYEGNYVKDLSLLNRDLSQSIIIDNSPASYLFHPENAIDCSSFIDDVTDRELDHIGKFLVGVKDVQDLRGTVNLW